MNTVSSNENGTHGLTIMGILCLFNIPLVVSLPARYIGDKNGGNNND
jgi:hypothetical protein